MLGAAEGPEDGVAEGDAVAVRKQVLEKPVEVTDCQEAWKSGTGVGQRSTMVSILASDQLPWV